MIRTGDDTSTVISPHTYTAEVLTEFRSDFCNIWRKRNFVDYNTYILPYLLIQLGQASVNLVLYKR